MDRHDIAHYGIAGSLLAAVFGVYETVPPRAKDVYPSITEQSAKAFSDAVKSEFPKGVGVLCIEASCKRAATAVAHAMGERTDRPIWIPHGVTVGASTQEEADKLSRIVEATLHIKPVDAVPKQPTTYIGFGEVPEGS